MAYPYDQGMVPPGYGMQAPGLFGSTMGAMGFGAGSGMEQQQYAAAGGSQLGAGVVGGMSAIPGMAMAGFGIAGMVAPMFTPGMRPGLGRFALRAADELDPMSLGMRFGGMGGRAGYGMGSRLFGAHRASRLAGGMMPAIGRAFSHGGMRAGLGMVGRFGAAGAMGGMGALGAAALPIGAGMAAMSAVEYGASSMYQGATDVMAGQSLMNQLGPSIAPGQSMRGEGAQTGRMMRDMAGDLGTGMEDISRFAKQLNSQRVFQTTRSAKEFRDKFKEVMGAVKEIAKITQGSVDDAMKMFSDLRQQGFYTTSDIKAQAASRQAREMTTGISAGVQSAIGGAGAQMARQYGMRGRFGARLAERNVAGVSMGVRSGAMSEEEVMEMGGTEAVGMRMAQQQMGFLRSSRGRAMIAYAMGEGGAPDTERLNRLMSGASMEDIVTGAAGRGLGVLQRAGSREAREQFAPYAGMAMVQMAAAQQKQLYGTTSRQGILNMMGTMGVGRQEANIMLQQTVNMPEQMRREREAEMTARARAREESMRSEGGIVAGVSRFLEREIGDPMRGIGSGISQQVAGTYGRTMRRLAGGEEYTGGDDRLARRFRASGGALTLGMGTSERRNPFGIDRASDRLADQYSDFVYGSAAEMGMSEEELEKELASPTSRIRDLGRDAGGTGFRRFVRTDEIEKAEESYRRGRERGGTGRSRAALNRFLTERDEKTGIQGSWAGRDTEGKIRQARLRRAANQGFMSTLGALSEGFAGGILQTLDITGTLAESSKKHRELTLMQQSGLVSEYMTMDEFSKMDKQLLMEKRGDLHEMLSRTREGVKQLEKLPGGGQVETGLLATRDIQSTRDEAERLLTSKLSKKFGRWGGTLRQRGSQTGLGERLAQDGEARQAYDDFLAIAMQEGEEGFDVEKYEAAKKRLVDAVGGEETSLGRAVMDQAGQLAAMDPEEKKKFAEETRNILGQQAVMEQRHRDSAGLKRRLKKMGDLRDIEDEKLRENVRALRIGGTAGRQEGMEKLILESITSDGGLSEEEIKVLNQVGGGAQGKRLASVVEQLRKGEGADVKQLRDEGFLSKEQLTAIKGAESPEKQAELIAEAIKKAGLTDTAAFGSSEGAKDVRSVQREYVEANEQFVQTVWNFISALPEDITGGVMGPAVSDVGDAAADLSSNGSNY